MNIFFLHFTNTALLLCNILFIHLLVFCQDLVNNGALVGMANKFDETPLDKATKRLANILKGMDSNVQMSTAQLYQLFFFSVFKLCLVYLLGIVYSIQNYMYVHVNFVLFFNVFFIRSCCATWAGLAENTIQRQELVRI